MSWASAAGVLSGSAYTRPLATSSIDNRAKSSFRLGRLANAVILAAPFGLDRVLLAPESSDIRRINAFIHRVQAPVDPDGTAASTGVKTAPI